MCRRKLTMTHNQIFFGKHKVLPEMCHVFPGDVADLTVVRLIGRSPKVQSLKHRAYQNLSSQWRVVL